MPVLGNAAVGGRFDWRVHGLKSLEFSSPRAIGMGNVQPNGKESNKVLFPGVPERELTAFGCSQPALYRRESVGWWRATGALATLAAKVRCDGHCGRNG
jgi:hypothetical protein